MIIINYIISIFCIFFFIFLFLNNKTLLNFFFFFQAEDGIRDGHVTGVQTCALPIFWKARPTVAGRVGGIVVQIEDGVTGWLVESPQECARACIEILKDPTAARQRALRGKEHVRRHFLTPRLLRDWLALFNRLSGHDTAEVELVTVAAA